MTQDFNNYVNQFIQQSIDPYFQPIVNYALLGGKQLRAKLLIAVGQQLGQPKEVLFPVALAVECLHAYTLVHDDLPAMDNDDYRRGQPSVHKAFNEAKAILAGDGLLSLASEIITNKQLFPNEYRHLLVDINYQLMRLTGLKGLIKGQYWEFDVQFKTQLQQLSLQQQQYVMLEQMQLKTGKLFGFSVLAPFMLQATTASQQEEALLLGETLGILFQLKDDVDDFTLQQEPWNICNLLPMESVKNLHAEYSLTATQLNQKLFTTPCPFIHQYIKQCKLP